MSDFLKQTESVILKRALLCRDHKVLVAVSGGIDSMVLLFALNQLSRKHSWKLTVAHLNHCLRGRSSDADERLVAQTAERLGLRLVSASADIKNFARKKKVSIEMAARQLRHEFLAQSARRLRIRTIALAHHADDQLELFFLRLLRGSGIEGLTGMGWQSVSPADARITLVRPFLDRAKSDLLMFAAENQIRFREDASNISEEFQRNRIRHELIPLIQNEYQPALRRVIQRVIDISGQNADFVSQTASAWLEGAEKDFDDLHPAVQRRCLQLQLIELGIPVDFDLVESLRTEKARPVSVGSGEWVVRDGAGRVQVQKSQGIITNPGGETTVKLTRPSGSVDFDGVKITWQVPVRKLETGRGAVPGREVFDADKIGQSIVLRHWEPGDRFQPIGMTKPVKMQDLFVNQKIPRDQRHRLVVAATESGEIFWVEKLRISEQFKVLPKTIRRLLWRWNPI